MSNKKKAANIVNCATKIEEEIVKRDKYQLNWNEIKKAKEIRNQYFPDCGEMLIMGDEVKDDKKKSKE